MPLLCGCGEQVATQKTPGRPVTFVVLKESNPTQNSRLTGSVESWKKEMLSCRVAGRVTGVVEPGINIEGRVDGEDGDAPIERGTLLATLDSDRYELQRNEAAARLDLTRARVKQAETELAEGIPARINEATAERDRRESEFNRESKLLEQNAGSRSDYEEAENWYKQSEALLAQARVEQATKAAELAALNAQVREAEQALQRADIDLSDCQLFSPFSGQVSKVHAIAGSFLDTGMPVVTVQMMDPVKVELAVSQETDRRLRYNDELNVYVDDSAEPINGLVYLKDTVADAATRTFNVTILVRNRQIESGLSDVERIEGLPTTSELFHLEAKNADDQPPFFSEQDTIHYDADEKPFLWKVNELKAADLRQDFDPVFTVTKVPVEIGDGRLSILQLYLGREIVDVTKIDPLQDLFTGQLPDGVKDGDTVALSRKEWMLRPGQLVHVELKGRTVSSGFYVPRPAILRSNGKHYVFVSESSPSGQETARRVEVNVAELVRDYRRIEPIDEGELTAGDKLIVDGTHYLRDGDSVNAFDEIEVAL